VTFFLVFFTAADGGSISCASQGIFCLGTLPERVGWAIFGTLFTWFYGTRFELGCAKTEMSHADRSWDSHSSTYSVMLKKREFSFTFRLFGIYVRIFQQVTLLIKY